MTWHGELVRLVFGSALTTRLSEIKALLPSPSPQASMKFFIFLAFVLVFPCSQISANVVWPALYAEMKVGSLPVILLSLVIEAIAIRRLFEISVSKSVFYAIIANAVSGILGLYLRPLAGLAWEMSFGTIAMLLFDWGTFNPITWFSVPIVGGLVNALIELFVYCSIWREIFSRRNFLSLWVLNALTIGLATLSVFFTMSRG